MGSQTKVYRVTGEFKNGHVVSHLTGAITAYHASLNVKNADPRINRIINIEQVKFQDLAV